MVKHFTYFFLSLFLLPIFLNAQILQENFDAISDIPVNWQKLEETSSSYYGISISSTSYSKPNSVKFYGSGNDTENLVLISPEVDFTTASSYKVSFYLYGGSNNLLEVGTISNPADISTYTMLHECKVVNGYEQNYVEVFVSPDALTHLAFKHQSGTTYLDNVLVEKVLPYDLKLEQLTQEKAILENSSFNYSMIVKNAGTTDASFNLSASSELATTIFDKSMGAEITSIDIPALSQDTIVVKLTTSQIQTQTQLASFDLQAVINEQPERKESIAVDFKIYKPYTEIEEGFEINTLPFGWVTMGEPDGVKFYKSSSNAHSGVCYTQLNASDASEPNRLISPVLKAYEGSYKLSMWLKGSDEVELGVITNMNDWSSYQSLGSVVGEGFSYGFVSLEGITLSSDAHIVFSFVGNSSYAKAVIDDIDIEKEQEYAVDVTGEYLQKSGYTGTSVQFPLFVINKGKKDETFNFDVDSEWDYKFLASDTITEINDVLVPVGERDTVFILVDVPNQGIVNGQSALAQVKVSCKNNVDNFEQLTFKTAGYFYNTYIYEDFEKTKDAPVNWTFFKSGSSAAQVATYGSYEGANCMRIYQSSSATSASYIATSMFKASEQAYSIKFWAEASGLPADFEVGLITDVNDFSTYHKIQTISPTKEYTEYTINNVVLDEASAFVFASEAGGKTVYFDNILISQTSANVDFFPAQASELTNTKPDLFVYFSKPVVNSDNSEFTIDNLPAIIELRKDSKTGEKMPLSYILAEDKQSVKLMIDDPLAAGTYYIIVNDGLNDVDGNSIIATQTSFTILDVVAPKFIEAFPTVKNIQETTFDLSVQSNESGKVYYMIVAHGSAAPTAQEVKEGVAYGDATLVAAENCAIEVATTKVLTVENLQALTRYDVYLTLEDEYSNLQGTVAKLEISTVDLTAPVFSANYPTVDAISKTSFNINLLCAEEATIYYILVADEVTAPVAEQIKNAADYKNVTILKGGNVKVNKEELSIETIDGLSENTAYDVYLTIEDIYGNLQSDVVKFDVLTEMSTGIDVNQVLVEIYPNPASEYIEIHADETIESYTVINVIGKIVKKGIGEGDCQIIDVISLDSGVYFIVVKTLTGKKAVRRIVVK